MKESSLQDYVEGLENRRLDKNPDKKEEN